MVIIPAHFQKIKKTQNTFHFLDFLEVKGGGVMAIDHIRYLYKTNDR